MSMNPSIRDLIFRVMKIVLSISLVLAVVSIFAVQTMAPWIHCIFETLGKWLTPYILVLLVIPTIILAILSSIAGFLTSNQSMQSLLINLGTGFIGVLFTVLYVDIVREHHEDRRWARADEVMMARLLNFAYGVNTVVREVLDVRLYSSGEDYLTELKYAIEQECDKLGAYADPEVLFKNVCNRLDEDGRRFRVTEQILSNINSYIGEMTDESWRKMLDKLNEYIHEYYQIVISSPRRIPPNIAGTIAEMLKCMIELEKVYQVQVIVLQTLGNQARNIGISSGAVRTIKNLLELDVKLLRELQTETN
jgi:hypothetical protein